MYHIALRTASAIALAAALGSTPAKAADLGGKDESRLGGVGYEHTWTGAYVSGGVGYEKASLEGFGMDIGGEGFLGNGRIGYDQQIGSLLLGAFGEARFNDLSIGLGGPSVESDWSWGFGGRAGVVLGNSLIYGTGGWGRREISFSNCGGSCPGLDDVDEWFYGGGIEVHAGGPFFVGAEVRQHIASDDDLPTGLEADSFSGMLSITFKADPFQ
jgi:hypothetical protein